jgi:hypothetical protein
MLNFPERHLKSSWKCELVVSNNIEAHSETIFKTEAATKMIFRVGFLHVPSCHI